MPCGFEQVRGGRGRGERSASSANDEYISYTSLSLDSTRLLSLPNHIPPMLASEVTNPEHPTHVYKRPSRPSRLPPYPALCLPSLTSYFAATLGLGLKMAMAAELAAANGVAIGGGADDVG